MRTIDWSLVTVLEAEYLGSKNIKYRSRDITQHELRLDDGELVAAIESVTLRGLKEACVEASAGGKHRIRVSFHHRGWHEDREDSKIRFRIIDWAIARYAGNEPPPRWTWNLAPFGEVEKERRRIVGVRG